MLTISSLFIYSEHLQFITDRLGALSSDQLPVLGWSFFVFESCLEMLSIIHERYRRTPALKERAIWDGTGYHLVTFHQRLVISVHFSRSGSGC